MFTTENEFIRRSWRQIYRLLNRNCEKKCDELDRYLEVNEDEDTLKNEVLHSVATALANMVLPFVFWQVDFLKNPELSVQS